MTIFHSSVKDLDSNALLSYAWIITVGSFLYPTRNSLLGVIPSLASSFIVIFFSVFDYLCFDSHSCIESLCIDSLRLILRVVLLLCVLIPCILFLLLSSTKKIWMHIRCWQIVDIPYIFFFYSVWKFLWPVSLKLPGLNFIPVTLISPYLKSHLHQSFIPISLKFTLLYV